MATGISLPGGDPYGLAILNPTRVWTSQENPCRTQDLRAKPRGFRPPQSLAYVDTKTGDRLIRNGRLVAARLRASGVWVALSDRTLPALRVGDCP